MTDPRTGDTGHSQDELQALIGDDYRLQFIIGHGGMSTVWLAHDMAHGRDVALKVLRPEFSDNHEFLSRFRNEARAARTIESVNVVRTHDYREVRAPAGNTFCFIVMEYVRGESLADLIHRRGQLEEPLALDVIEQAAHGLAVIHGMGMVHRDVKPGNLLITPEGTVKITDFGIAKAAAAVPLTRTGMVVGTVQYVSPEQAQGKDVDSASDVYSLAVVGFELLSGHRPFTGDSSVSVAIAHINTPAPQLPGSITDHTRELIGLALRKDPARRYADGTEFAHAISAVRMGQRPPLPHAAAAAVAPAPPTDPEARLALGRATVPTTTYPEDRRPGGPRALPDNIRPEIVQSSGSNLKLWVIVVVLVAMAVAVAAIAWSTTRPAGNQLPPPVTQLPPVVSSTAEPAPPVRPAPAAPEPATPVDQPATQHERDTDRDRGRDLPRTTTARPAEETTTRPAAPQQVTTTVTVEPEVTRQPQTTPAGSPEPSVSQPPAPGTTTPAGTTADTPKTSAGTPARTKKPADNPGTGSTGTPRPTGTTRSAGTRTPATPTTGTGRSGGATTHGEVTATGAGPAPADTGGAVSAEEAL